MPTPPTGLLWPVNFPTSNGMSSMSVAEAALGHDPIGSLFGTQMWGLAQMKRTKHPWGYREAPSVQSRLLLPSLRSSAICQRREVDFPFRSVSR
jgi:hypothetical protein